MFNMICEGEDEYPTNIIDSWNMKLVFAGRACLENELPALDPNETKTKPPMLVCNILFNYNLFKLKALYPK